MSLHEFSRLKEHGHLKMTFSISIKFLVLVLETSCLAQIEAESSATPSPSPSTTTHPELEINDNNRLADVHWNFNFKNRANEVVFEVLNINEVFAATEGIRPFKLTFYPGLVRSASRLPNSRVELGESESRSSPSRDF